MWAIGVPLLGLGYAIADDGEALAGAAAVWTTILAIDLLVSFPYTLSPADRRS
jgi:hypothetical protein